MSKKPLVILFDASALVNGNKSGVGYYTKQLIQSLADTYPEDLQLIGHYFSFLGRKDSIELPKAPNIRYKRSRLMPGKVMSLTRKLGFQLPLEFLFRRRGDIALFPNFSSLPSLTGVPTFVAVHDLCFVDVPEFVTVKNRLFLQRFVPRSIKQSRRVITISEATKQAVIKNYQTPADKIFITPIPPAPKPEPSDVSLEEMGINKPYILFVSTLEPRKNVINLVKAYESLNQKVKNKYQLILAGGPGWYMEQTMDYIAERQTKGDQIVTTGYVSDAQRDALYRNASLFAFPSHYEGFGMPILEAMDYDVPTVVSDIPVFHEVAGDATLYFDKDNPAAIAKTIEDVLGNPGQQKELVSKGHDRLKHYDWQAVAEQVYKEIQASLGAE